MGHYVDRLFRDMFLSPDADGAHQSGVPRFDVRQRVALAYVCREIATGINDLAQPLQAEEVIELVVARVTYMLASGTKSFNSFEFYEKARITATVKPEE